MYASEINLGNPHPANSAGFFSNLTFAWFRKVCRISINKTFNISDLYECLEEDKCEAIGSKLEKNWNQEILLAKTRNTNPSLLKAIVKTFIWKYLLYSSIFLFQLVIMLITKPIILEILINLFSLRGNETSNKILLLYLYGGGLVMVTLLGIIIEHRTIFLLARIGMQLTNASSYLLYGKILRLSKKSLMKVSSGHVINLLSNDIHKLDSLTPFLMHLWIAPIFFIVSTIFVWNQMQLAGIIGIAFLIIALIPLNVVTSSLMTKWRFDSLKITDKRITQISEILFGIKTIKMYAWEKPFIRLVKTMRKQEMQIISKMLYLFGIFYCSEIFVEKLILFIILVSFVSMGNSITADKVFSTSFIINILQSSAAVSFPLALNIGAEGLISIRRLQKILLMEEKPASSINHTTSGEIFFKRVSFSWTHQTTLLNDISVNFKPGSLCAIVGPVGSGKSSMLHLLMGELIQDEGNITVGGKTAYCSQKPWLFSSTVRQNILFGQSYDDRLYKSTIKVCALEKDLELFPENDQTIIGEKGIKISGGQKARINLARTIYRKANIYLLDDPLSALDASVGKEVFENCVMQFLKNKTRILVTHQLHYLKTADYIIVLNKGKIEARGTYPELLKMKSEFTNSLSNSTEGNKFSHEERSFESKNVYSENITKSEEIEVTKSEEFVYWKYIKYGKNNFLLCIAIFFLILGQFWGKASEFWITAWISQNSLAKFPSNASNNDFLLSTTLSSNAEYIYVYAALIAGCTVFLIMGSIHFYKHSTWISKNLHKHMLTSLLQTSVEFFDTETSGKMLTRLARDTAIVDERLPSATYRGVQTILASIGILIVVLITNPYMILAVIVLSVPCNKLRRYYSSVSRLIKFLESRTESSVFSYITATFDGVATIRNSEMEKVLRNEFTMLRNRTTSANCLYLVSQGAFAMWIDAICCFLLLFVIFSFSIMVQYNIVNEAYVGLAISQTLILLAIVARGLLQITDGIVDLTSVERILEYTKLPREEFLISSKSNVKLWPHEGRLRFFNVSLKYFSSRSLILKNLNLIVNPGEKVGIVGRTGAGKSSLISALFRLIPIQGNIILDDRDIQTVPLEELRSNISVIPQEPILFSGTLRYNLDPHRQFSDEEIYNALGDVQLRDANLPLDYFVNEGGSNFSVGQRQLMCLARAILRKTKILVLDEATANVDYKTDELIQETIRKKFNKCTVLTIAHRLNTIMESDKVLVMEEGQIVEYDQPSVLLQNRKGYFYKLASGTGVQN